MDKNTLVKTIIDRKSCLCVGLDPDMDKFPQGVSRDAEGVYRFCCDAIDATLDFAVSYKLNLAFFECLGIEGWQIVSELVKKIPKSHFSLADAKRGDIGNTSKKYAEAFYDVYGFDSMTISPYMGSDSVQPFLREDKWAIVLGLTSNEGNKDVQMLDTSTEKVFLSTMRKVASWGHDGNTMFVIGATNTAYLKSIRQEFPKHFFLVPGVGAQGGSLEEVMRHASNDEVGLLINSSREILYTNESNDYKMGFYQRAKHIANQMKEYM
jgi:orotidine-5'-phosphate decarboxylase